MKCTLYRIIPLIAMLLCGLDIVHANPVVTYATPFPNSMIATIIIPLIACSVIDVAICFMILKLLEIAVSRKTFTIFCIATIIIGFICDYVGIYLTEVLRDSTMFTRLTTILGGDFIWTPITAYTAGMLLLISDYVSSKLILKTNCKQSLLIALAIAIFTNPIIGVSLGF